NVSTLISLTFSVASLKIAVLTFVVITESSTYSPVPSFVAVEPHPQAEANTMVRTRNLNPLSDLMASLDLHSIRMTVKGEYRTASQRAVLWGAGANPVLQRIRDIGRGGEFSLGGQGR